MTKRRLKLLRTVKIAIRLASVITEIILEKLPYLMAAAGLILMLGAVGRMDMNVELMIPDSPSVYYVLVAGVALSGGGIYMLTKEGKR